MESWSLVELYSWHCELGNLCCLLGFWLMGQDTRKGGVTSGYFLSEDYAMGIVLLHIFYDSLNLATETIYW